MLIDFLLLYTGARGTDHLTFSNFLFSNLFSIKFLYFFIISSLFPYFNLFVDQYSYNLMLTSNCICRPYINTNNPQGMQLLRFKNRTPARFRVHLLHLISIMSFKLGHVPIPKRRIFLPLFLFCVQRRSCIYAVTPWRAHRQVKKKNKKIKKCIVNFNSIINISLIRHTSYFCMVVM